MDCTEKYVPDGIIVKNLLFVVMLLVLEQVQFCAFSYIDYELNMRTQFAEHDISIIADAESATREILISVEFDSSVGQLNQRYAR